MVKINAVYAYIMGELRFAVYRPTAAYSECDLHALRINQSSYWVVTKPELNYQCKNELQQFIFSINELELICQTMKF